MRCKGIICAAILACLMTAGAVAQAPPRPSGNFGGGALVAPPRAHFGAGNVVIGLRALPDRKLEIEAAIRASCPGAAADARTAGADISADAKIAADGGFTTEGEETSEPDPGVPLKTKYKLSGKFTSASAVDGTISATIDRGAAGMTKRCRTGDVEFGARRPSGQLGARGARSNVRYYGTTTQRGVGPRRAIVLRLSGDGLLITRGLFGESVTCSDGKRSSGIEAPRTNIRVNAKGRVTDRERFTINNGATETKVNDHFSATLGEEGAKGTFSLSDHTVDRATGREVQSCRSGTIKWVAAP
ncbi:MAG: hypothetical protein QOK16_3019 [Solirubrobacteraceae bacterium]|nr:hypothetical protein [Solirubrobacteraceae bacterium]